MKKFIILAFMVSFFATAPQTFAVAPKGETQNSQALKKALWQRYVLYRNNKNRTTAVTNTQAQLEQHKISRAEKGVTERSTISNRKGELKFVPHYSKRRGTSNLSSAVPNTVKRNFKVRAIDYYVEGGEAGRKVLLENAYDGKNNKVEVRNSLSTKPSVKNVANIIKVMRARQKYRSQISDDSALKTTSTKTGDWRRNLVHPYMFRSKK